MTKGFDTLYCIILIIFLVGVFFATFDFATRGYGYPGYRGYHRAHHSRWYGYNHDSAYYPSVRENSVAGSRFSRKGISGGK